MEINVVLDHLNRFDLKTVSRAQGPTYIQTHKMIRPGQTTFFHACLYVGYVSELANELDPSETANLICIEDEPFPFGPEETSNANVFLVPDGTDQFAVLNRIADILIDEAAIVAGMRRLIDTLAAGQGLQAIVDVASGILGNPVFVNDMSYKILANSLPSVLRNESLERGRSSGYIAEENIAAMRRDGVVIESKHAREGLVRMVRPDTEEEWIFKDVRVNGVSVATVAVVDNDKPFRENFDVELVNRLGTIVALELQKSDLYRGSRSVMSEYFINDLLSGKLHDDEAIAERCRIVGWHVKEHFRLFAVVNPKGRIEPESSGVLVDVIRGVVSDCRWANRQGSLVFIVSRKSEVVLTEREIRSLSNRLAGSGFVCGVSDAFDRLSGCARALREASRAAEAGSIVGAGTDTVFCYGDMMPYYLAQLGLKRNDLDVFRPVAIRKLQEYDREHDGELCSTLKAYLEMPEDTATVAARLNVHRNTLLYRLRKMKELTGEDLSDGVLRFKLQLYFMMEEYQTGWNR